MTLDNAVACVGGRPTSGSSLRYAYALASIGFGFMIGWDVIGLFAPASPLLAYGSITQALVLCTVAIGAMAVFYPVCVRFARRMLSRCLPLAVTATACGQAVVVCALVRMVVPMPLAVDLVAWMLFGMSKAMICLAWCVYMSTLPTKHTGVVIGGGGVLGTLLFVAVSLVEPPAACLVAIAALPVASLLILLLLFRDLPAGALADENYLRPQSVSSKSAALSYGTQGAVYGFITFYMCLLGPEAAVIVGGSGLVGCVLVMVLMRLMPRISLGYSVIQRVSQPIVVMGLLLMPLLSASDRIVCGCIVNIALSFANIAAWCAVSIENSEFRLQPILRFAGRQAPLWVGAFVGAVAATTFSGSASASDGPFTVIALALACCVVVAFSFYGADDSAANHQLEALMTVDEPVGEASEAVDRASFEERCREVCTAHGLSPRESEVFALLARGRNAKIIQEELCVSASTVKTHIYRIYRKMGINSQQLLIDAVEERAPEAALRANRISR